MPILLAALGPLLMQVLRWLFLAKLASFIARAFAVLGIAWATNEYLMEPLIEQATNAWLAMPVDLVQWLTAFGIPQVVSILLSAYAIYGVKQLVLVKA